MNNNQQSKGAEMDTFLAAYLSKIAADFTVKIISSLGRTLRKSFERPEHIQALQRCIDSSVVMMLSIIQSTDKEQTELLDYIFRSFFSPDDNDVARELARVLEGSELNKEEMKLLFKEAGWKAEKLPLIDLDQMLDRFERCFIVSLAGEPLFQGVIQTRQLVIQTEQRNIIQAIYKFLDKANRDTIEFRENLLTALDRISNKQISVNISGFDIISEGSGWEEHYLKTIISRCNILDISAIETAQTQQRTNKVDNDIKISDVFTTLYLQGINRNKNESIFKAFERILNNKIGYLVESEKNIPIQAIEAVAALKHVVILGTPGGGKSTMVNHLATQLAMRRLNRVSGDENLPGWDENYRPVPVRIVLRFFANELPIKIPSEKTGLVWNYLEKYMEDAGCKEYYKPLRNELINKGGAILFDGLDEVSEKDEINKRNIIKEAILDFARPLDKCRIVITCREYAYKDKDGWWLPENLFPVFTLAPFNLEQIAYFNRVWYKTIGPLKEWNEEKCSSEAEHLTATIKELPNLFELAVNPLLLTLMAYMHGTSGTLPDDRADLYEGIIKLLMVSWENRIARDLRAQKITDEGMIFRLQTSMQKIRPALEEVAFIVHEKQEKQKARDEKTADISKSQLMEALDRELSDSIKAKEVIEYIQVRAGLLIAKDNSSQKYLKF